MAHSYIKMAKNLLNCWRILVLIISLDTLKPSILLATRRDKFQQVINGHRSWPAKLPFKRLTKSTALCSDHNDDELFDLATLCVRGVINGHQFY